jgi:hypothetical protein
LRTLDRAETTHRVSLRGNASPCSTSGRFLVSGHTPTIRNLATYRISAVPAGVDTLVAEVGGFSIAAGGNIGDGAAVCEATHGWQGALDLVVRGMETAIGKKTVTYDLARQMPGATELSTSGFGDAIIAGMRGN